VRGCGAAGSAPHWQCGGQGFESPQLHPIRHCAHRGVPGARFCSCGLLDGDSEDRDDAGVGDPDLVDEGFDEFLAFGDIAAGDCRVELVAELFEGDGARWSGSGFQFVGEPVSVGFELGDFGAELAEAGAGGGRFDRAGLERGVVPVEGVSFGGQLGDDRVAFGVLVGLSGGVLGLGSGDGVGDPRAGSPVEVAERGEDGGVEFFGAVAGCVARDPAVPRAGVAGVVAVAVAFARPLAELPMYFLSQSGQVIRPVRW
jgi:hypothetical protein